MGSPATQRQSRFLAKNFGGAVVFDNDRDAGVFLQVFSLGSFFSYVSCRVERRSNVSWKHHANLLLALYFHSFYVRTYFVRQYLRCSTMPLTSLRSVCGCSCCIYWI